MNKKNEIMKGRFLHELDYEFESHSYSDNQLEIEMAIKSAKKEIFRF